METTQQNYRQNNSVFKSASNQNPCPRCGRKKWCSEKLDGSAVFCRHDDTGIHKVDKTGADYWIFPSNGELYTQKNEIDPPPLYIKRASPEILDSVYVQLLLSLPLDDGHKEDLIKRGLSEKAIDQNFYRTSKYSDRDLISVKLINIFGFEKLESVPGFIAIKDDTIFNAPSGILIPVRNIKSQIIAIKVRTDNESKDLRYYYLSSKKYNGPGSGSPVHVPLHEHIKDTSEVRATEGELKADVATKLSGKLTISVSGVQKWSSAIPFLKELNAKTVIIAFDMEFYTNENVKNCLIAFFKALVNEGFSLEIEKWDQKYKGIDDALAAGIPIEVLRGFDTVRFIQSLEDSVSQKQANKDQWEQPKPLPALLPEAPTLPIELIPGPFREWAVDTAERLQTLPEFVLGPTFCSLGSVIGRQIAIYPKEFDTDWKVSPTIWGANIARPGKKKSPIFKAGIGPLEYLERISDGNFERELSQAKVEIQLLDARLKAEQKKLQIAAGKDQDVSSFFDKIYEIEQEIQSKLPVKRRYRANDSTVPKLGEILNENPNGILVFRDELTGLLRSLDNKDNPGDREFYLEAWNGQGSYRIDRIGRGSLHLKFLTLTLIGAFQPGKLQSYVSQATKGGFYNDGLIQRFQVMIWPEDSILETLPYVDRKPSREGKERTYKIFKTLDQIDVEKFGIEKLTNGLIPALNFEPQAQRLFNEYQQDLHYKVSKGNHSDSFKDHLSKYASLMPALSLLFHLIDSVEGKSTSKRVSLDSARMAGAWCDFLEAHARKVYSIVSESNLHKAHELAKKIKLGKVKNGDTIRQVYRHHWQYLNKQSDVESAISTLEEYGWLKIVELGRPGGGPKSEIIELSPYLIRGDKK